MFTAETPREVELANSLHNSLMQLRAMLAMTWGHGDATNPGDFEGLPAEMKGNFMWACAQKLDEIFNTWEELYIREDLRQPREASR